MRMLRLKAAPKEQEKTAISGTSGELRLRGGEKKKLFGLAECGRSRSQSKSYSRTG